MSKYWQKNQIIVMNVQILTYRIYNNNRQN